MLQKVALTVSCLLLSLIISNLATAQETVDLSAPIETTAQCANHLVEIWHRLDTGTLTANEIDLDALFDNRACRYIADDDEQHYLKGRLLLLSDNSSEAIDRFHRARRAHGGRPGERPTEAEILYYLGLANEMAGETERAIDTYLELANDFPADARVALVLPLIPQAAAITPEDRLDAAIQAVETHNYSAASRLLSQILEELVGEPVQPHDPDYQRLLTEVLATDDGLLGETTYQLGYLWYYWIRSENPQAAPLLQIVAESGHRRAANARYYLARSYMRAEDYDSAREHWTLFANEYPRDDRAHEATYYNGWLYLDREDFEMAIQGFDDYLENFPRGDRASRAVWYAGWARFRMGAFSEARVFFERLYDMSGYLRGAKGGYWLARCYQEEGMDDEANAIFEELGHNYGFTYYGMLARQRLGLPIIPAREHDPPPSPTVRLAELATDNSELETLEQLIDVGDPYRTWRFYRATQPQNEPSEQIDQFLVAHAAGDAYDDYNEARDMSTTNIRRPMTDRTFRQWIMMYPRPYTSWIESAAEEWDFDPLFVWSIIQIESHYNSTFVSYADAQGLMQLIPRTGQNTAEEIGEFYVEGMLMNPAVNVRYGIWYLSALMQEFNGQIPLVITSYNSGAHSMHRWVDENNDLPLDEFVEEIAYDQSREYVKRVLGHYAHYLYLYATNEELEATLPRLFPEDVESGYRGRIGW